MNPMLASVMLFAGNFAPRGWAFCDGQLLSINANQALFSLLGTTYGGDGRTTFGLPDLRGRTPIGPRTGPGLSTYRLGQRGGVEIVTLTINQIPSHTHTPINNLAADQHVLLSTTQGVRSIPQAGDVPAGAVTAPSLGTGDPVNAYGPAVGTVNGQTISGSAGLTIANTGGSQYHTNIKPFLGLNYIIALLGFFPSRN